MQQKAILYTRVSTDEQAQNYSLADQKARLEKYCQNNQIEIIDHFQDDHSAKSFKRPAFQEFLLSLKKKNRTANLLLFVNWSRFSRNTSEAYQMIDHLHKHRINLIAIDQPVDLSIPESRVMLAIYLSTPEAENERRSLNVTNGMRRAQRQGRYISKAPRGYKNSRDEFNKPVIVPCPDKAPIVREIFENIANNGFSGSQALLEARRQGFKCSQSQFYSLIKNKVYMGKVFVAETKDEAAEWVDGIHEGLISEELFYKVNDKQDKKTKNRGVRLDKHAEELILRGNIRCNRCGKNLTGSPSRGNGGEYFYYHCKSPCGERFRTDEAHNSFQSLLKTIKLLPEADKLYREILADVFQEGSKLTHAKRRKIQQDIYKQEKRLEYLQDMLMDQKIDPKEYSEIKLRYDGQINRLKLEKNALSGAHSTLLKELTKTTDALLNIDEFYNESSQNDKKRIIGFMFPEKLVFDGQKVRTTKVNDVVEHILLTNSKVQSKKIGTNANESIHSYLVNLIGVEPNLYSFL